MMKLPNCELTGEESWHLCFEVVNMTKFYFGTFSVYRSSRSFVYVFKNRLRLVYEAPKQRLPRLQHFSQIFCERNHFLGFTKTFGPNTNGGQQFPQTMVIQRKLSKLTKQVLKPLIYVSLHLTVHSLHWQHKIVAKQTWCKAVSPSMFAVSISAPLSKSLTTSSLSPLEHAARNTQPSWNFIFDLDLSFGTLDSLFVSDKSHLLSCSSLLHRAFLGCCPSSVAAMLQTDLSCQQRLEASTASREQDLVRSRNRSGSGVRE